MKKYTLLRLMTIVALVVVVSSLAFLTGCKEETTNETSNEATSDNTGSKLSGTIDIIGSTSVQPLAEELAKAFMDKEGGVKINVQGIGSSAGVKAAKDGTAQIGTSSRDLKEEEKTWGLQEYVIAIDGIAVVVHPDNKVEGLTKEEVTKIYKGEITNWSEVGGDDKKILVVSREEGSGTRGAFTEIMGLEAENSEGKKVEMLVSDAMIADSNGSVKASVSSKVDSIGYLSLGIVDDTVKSLKVDGTEASVETIKAGEYKIQRPFLMLTNKDKEDDIVKAFLDFILGEDGQKIAGNQYISVK